ncbi:MAG TPA: M20/M25/M40 family metallo-hydrolase [Bacteroidia bacterium]|nr:M20/M25/M40 family metallo-hydrolase [Bacteroidia bacterium]
MQLLKKLISIHAPSGNEAAMTEFLLNYIRENSKGWKVIPKIFYGDGFQNCIVLVFGKPKTAVFAHIDSIGFTVRYNNELVKIGGPHIESGNKLTGADSKGNIECVLMVDEDENIKYRFEREIERGTDLVFKANFREEKDFVQSNYLDNRLGVWVALKLSETLKNGAIVFSCWEEHGGGSAGYLAKFLYEKFKVRQALISDITWITEGVTHNKGVVVSMRDVGIPRKVFVDRVISILKEEKILFQLEVEKSGGSDGTEIQKIPYPIDWCFVGAAEDFVHSPDEKVHKKDIESMLEAYRVLMRRL